MRAKTDHEAKLSLRRLGGRRLVRHLLVHGRLAKQAAQHQDGNAVRRRDLRGLWLRGREP